MKILIIFVTAFLLENFGDAEEINYPASSKLCNISEPKFLIENDLESKSDNEIYRFYNKTGKCYKVGEKGPCNEMTIFYADPFQEDYGECDCDVHLRCHRPLIYWPSTDRCYYAYEKGPCQDSEWLSLNWKLAPACKNNPCVKMNNNGTEKHDEEIFDEEEEDGTFWINQKYSNECFKTDTQGFCKFPNEKITFFGFSSRWGPECSVARHECLLPHDQCLLCLPGQKWAETNLECKSTLKERNSFKKSGKRHHHKYHKRSRHNRHHYKPHGHPHHGQHHYHRKSPGQFHTQEQS